MLSVLTTISNKRKTQITVAFRVSCRYSESDFIIIV